MFKFINTAKNSETGKRIKEKIFPNPPEPEFKMAMERFRACDNIKKKSQMKREIYLYKKFWKCYPYDYFINDLYRSDNQITQEEIINYIPGFFWYELYLPHYTSYKYSEAIDNKIFTELFFNSLKIAQPEALCMVINNRLYSSEMVKSSFEQILLDIKRKSPHKLFVKPTESGAGRGIYIFNKSEGGQYSSHENVIFNENFLSMVGKSSDLIIQAGVEQDPEFSSIYPHSVNTCRIGTANMDGKSRVVCAMMRVGRSGKEIDNVSTGGLCTKIDINDGKLGDYAMSYDNQKFSEHPDTRFIFKNYKISRWNEIKKFASDSADKLPHFAHLGWDITLTEKGPLAIEPNLSFGIEALQIANGGLRPAFSIDNPDYYWKNLGKRE